MHIISANLWSVAGTYRSAISKTGIIAVEVGDSSGSTGIDVTKTYSIKSYATNWASLNANNFIVCASVRSGLWNDRVGMLYYTYNGYLTPTYNASTGVLSVRYVNGIYFKGTIYLYNT